VDAARRCGAASGRLNNPPPIFDLETWAQIHVLSQRQASNPLCLPQGTPRCAFYDYTLACRPLATAGYYQYDAKRKASPNPELSSFLDRSRQKAGLLGKGLIDPSSFSERDIMEFIFFPVVNEACRVVDEREFKSLAWADGV